MQYLLMIYANETEFNAQSKAELERTMADYNAFTTEIKQAGTWVAGARLLDTAKATTVRIRSGKVQVTDGPFAETREQLGGYYIVEAKDLDEATKLAAKIPSAKLGSIEIRPIWPM